MVAFNVMPLALLLSSSNEKRCDKYLKSGFIFITKGSVLTAISFHNLERSLERLIKANKEARANSDCLKIDNDKLIIFSRKATMHCFICSRLSGRMYAN